MKPESRKNILQKIAEAKQQIADLREKQEQAEITLQLLIERLFQHDKAKTRQTTDLSAAPFPRLPLTLFSLELAPIELWPGPLPGPDFPRYPQSYLPG